MAVREGITSVVTESENTLYGGYEIRDRLAKRLFKKHYWGREEGIPVDWNWSQPLPPKHDWKCLLTLEEAHQVEDLVRSEIDKIKEKWAKTGRCSTLMDYVALQNAGRSTSGMSGPKRSDFTEKGKKVVEWIEAQIGGKKHRFRGVGPRGLSLKWEWHLDKPVRKEIFSYEVARQHLMIVRDQLLDEGYEVELKDYFNTTYIDVDYPPHPTRELVMLEYGKGKAKREHGPYHMLSPDPAHPVAYIELTIKG